NKATLQIPGQAPIELPIYKGSIGPSVIDVTSLTQKGVFTYDPGFLSTAACESKITYIDGQEGTLLHRGYAIEELAEQSDYLEVCYLLLNKNLPSKQEKDAFVNAIKSHTLVHEQIRSFFNG